MFSSDRKSKSIGEALFEVGLQLTVPTVVCRESTGENKLRTFSMNVETDERRIRRSFSPSTNNRTSLLENARRSDLSKTKILRDVASQTDPTVEQRTPDRPKTLDLLIDKNNNQTGDSSISQTSTEYLSETKVATSNSLRNVFLGLWQGLNNDQLRSASSSPVDQKFFDERIRLSHPSWVAFSKAVTSLLTFTRSKKDKYQWIQLVGHPGTFREGIHDGFVLKQSTEHERRCCELLSRDVLKKFVPRYNGSIKDEHGKSFIEIEDLLSTFTDPCIMDCKIGVRTYLEEDLEKSELDPEPRADLYEKMISIDPTAPTEEERRERKVLKPRYMIWRENLSSTEELGFRIEAIKKSRGLMCKEFQRIKEKSDVKKQLEDFVGNSLTRALQYLQRLIELRSVCLQSEFFSTHELIGSSLLFIHDGDKASSWMIDFGKTRILPDNVRITHSKAWTRGSHEDGYLVGLDNLISLFSQIVEQLKANP